MLQTIMMSQEAVTAQEETLKLIYGGTVTTTSDWVETTALSVTEVLGEPFGRYFSIVMTNDLNQDDVEELVRLERELGKKLNDCVVERERINNPHPWFPGSRYFDLVTIYGG